MCVYIYMYTQTVLNKILGRVSQVDQSYVEKRMVWMRVIEWQHKFELGT